MIENRPFESGHHPRAKWRGYAPLRRWRTQVAVIALLISGCITPGGGAAEQVVPDVITAGQPATLQLKLSIFEANARVKGRFKDVALRYRLVGDSTFRVAQTPQPRQIARNVETYDFILPPFPPGTRGKMEFFFTAHLDGHPSPAIEGIKQVRVQ